MKILKQKTFILKTIILNQLKQKSLLHHFLLIRKNFEVNISGDELIVFRSSVLKAVNISRKELKESLINIIQRNILTRRQHQAVSKLIEKKKKRAKIQKKSVK